MTAAEPAIELRDVSRAFGNITALREVSWSVDRGGVVGLLGHNGAGKTTTLRLLSGVLAPTSGRIRVLGLDPTRQGAQLRRHVGVVLADPGIDRRLTGRENLKFTAAVYRLDADEVDARLGELATALHLDDRLDEPAAAYSDGMRRRLSLARMLLPDPAVLLLDEPTATLEPMAAHNVRLMLADVTAATKRTVVLATQDLLEAAELCDQVVVLQHGIVVASGAPSALARRVSARGLRLVIDQQSHAVVADIAMQREYTVEPLDAGSVRLHGVVYDEVPELVRALVAADVDVSGVAIDQPTLTDFYLATHRDGVAVPDA